MYHTTFDMTEFHGDFLGGFTIHDPQVGDTLQVADWPAHTLVGPIASLQDAADELNLSTDPGISKFQYIVRHQPLATPTLDFIHAQAKTPGADGWHFITYTGVGVCDAHSFRQPTWMYFQYDDPYFDFIAQNPALEPAMTFVDMISLDDTVSGTSNNQTYWTQAGYLKTELPSVDYPLGERRGHLPSWAGSGAFTNDVRVYTRDFNVPLGVTLFFVCNHAENPGKTDFMWKIVDEVTGDTVIEVKGKNFLIYTFIEPSQYSVYLSVLDSNGNFSEIYRKGFVRVEDIGHESVLNNYGDNPLEYIYLNLTLV